MTEFKFTVRATDSLGAFADREFSINVRNTIIDRWVATTSTGAIIRSPDGIHWESQMNVVPTASQWGATSPTVASRGAVSHFKGKWFINANPQYITSLDAKTWTPYSYPEINHAGANHIPIVSTVYIDSNWAKSSETLGIVISYKHASLSRYINILLMSKDGVTWEPKWIPAAYTSNVVDASTSRVIYGNGRWMISGNRRLSSVNIGIVSDDEGETWNNITIPGVPAFIAGDIQFLNGKWIVPLNTANAIYISDDLINWTYQLLPTITNNPGFRFINWNYGNGIISIFPEATTNNGRDWNMIYSTNNLIDWEVTPMEHFPIGNYNSGTLPTSVIRTSGTACYARISGTFYNGQFLFGSSYFIPTGANAGSGGLYSSTDGKNYEKLSIPADIGGDNAYIFGIGHSSY